MLLAIVAIATAWSGYQTGKWDRRQAHLYGLSNKYRVQTDSATTRATLRPLWMTSRRPGAPTVQSEMLGTSTRRTALAGLVDRSGAGRRSARLVEHRIRSSLLDRLLVRVERYDNSAQSERPDQRVWGALRDIELVRVGPQAFGRQAAGTGLCPSEDCRVGVGDQFRHHPAPVRRLFADDASSIPDEIKVGFCVAALCAGMPFAPILARLAKADVGIATTLLVVLTVGTIIALPIGLPLAIDAVDAQLKTSAWDVAWPLLLFLFLPLVLGCGFRVWWPDLTPPLAQWVVRVAILCLLFNLNFTLVAYWDLFEKDLGHRELHRGPCWPVHRPRVWLPSRFQPSSQRRGNQACGRGDHGGTQHRSDAPDDDLSLCSRPAGHGVDHDPQHRRHHDRSSIRPDVEARCFTIGHPRNYQPASKRRPAPANFDVT